MTRRLAQLHLRAESGFTMVAAVAVLAVMLTLGLAAVAATVATVNTSSRGTADAQALEAAEDAANLGWNRINLLHVDSLGLSVTTPCLSFDVSGNITAVAALVFGTTSWCPSVSVPVPGASSASYQISQLTLGTRYIVGTATVNGVTRRVELTLNQSTSGTSLFGSYAVTSEYDLDFQNGSKVTGGPVRSDGNIKLEDTQVPCHVPNGAITPGPGKTVITTNGAGTCGQSTTPATSAISWQTISTPTLDNDTDLLSATLGNGNVSWSATNRTLTINNRATVTLTGNTYTFCSLTINDGTLDLKPANGKAVQIYMLPPGGATCPTTTSGSQTLTLQNTDAYLKNDTGLSAAGLQIYLQGATTAYLNNDSTHQLNGVIYAPNNPKPSQSPPVTTVQVINSSALKGAIAAYSMTWTASSWLVYDSTASSVTTSTSGSIFYNQKQYVECPATVASGAAPNSGCPGS